MEIALDYKLYQELKSRYPEVPDDIVTCHMQQLRNDRDRCMETLAVESPKYLFGTNSNASSQQVNDYLVHRVRDLAVNQSEQRQRSDSNSSSMSNTSTNSGSNVSVPSRPPYTASYSLMTAGSRDPISYSEEDLTHPTTAPVVPSELNRFLFSNSPVPDTIPNITCNNSAVGYDNPPGSSLTYGLNYRQPNATPSPSQPPPQLRAIKVQHIRTEDGKEITVSNPPSEPPASFTYQIRFDPQTTNTGHSTLPPKPFSLNPVQPNTSNSGWLHHPVTVCRANMYSNVTYPNDSLAFSPDHHSVQGQFTPHTVKAQSPTHVQQFQPPTNSDRSYAPGVYRPNQFTGQHSSQATIFLQNPAAGNNQYSAERTADPPPHGGQYNNPQLSPYSDPRMSPVSYLRSPTSPGQPINQQANPQEGYSKPLYVEIKSSGPEGVRSHIQYFNDLANTPQPGNGSGRALPTSAGVSQVPVGAGNTPSVPSTLQPHTYVDRLNTAERPTVIDIQRASTSQTEGRFMVFPQNMPNVCRVPGHPKGPLKSASVDSESGASVFGSEIEYRAVPPRPFISPASSHSSLSSESSQREPPRPRSGSLQDDPAYTQALLSHQRSRMEKLAEDLQVAEKRLHDLKKDVNHLESSVIEKKRKRNSSFPSTADLAGLRSDNLQLQADIQLMTREVDLLNNGQTPLGVLDPLEQQNFYKTMNTGQRGSIYGGHQPLSSSSSGAPEGEKDQAGAVPRPPPPDIPPQLPPRDIPPPLPPRVHHVPPPPPQPVVSSGESDADGEQWNCSACTFLNHPALNKCECCEMPRPSTTTTNLTFSPPVDRDIPPDMP